MVRPGKKKIDFRILQGGECAQPGVPGQSQGSGQDERDLYSNLSEVLVIFARTFQH